MNKPFLARMCVLAVLFSGAAFPQQTALTPEHQTARDIFKELIEINTTDTARRQRDAAAEAMAARFRAAGFPAEDIHVLGPRPTRKTWSSACAAPAKPGPSCSSATLTW